MQKPQIMLDQGSSDQTCQPGIECGHRQHCCLYMEPQHWKTRCFWANLAGVGPELGAQPPAGSLIQSAWTTDALKWVKPTILGSTDSAGGCSICRTVQPAGVPTGKQGLHYEFRTQSFAPLACAACQPDICLITHGKGRCAYQLRQHGGSQVRAHAPTGNPSWGQQGQGVEAQLGVQHQALQCSQATL